MRQHPIPQNIMDVEFKLVGDLTIRQFGYCAVGLGLAYVMFAAPLPLLIRGPLAVFLGISGVALAFLPVDDRPLDIWLVNYIRAIYQPIRRTWQKSENIPLYLNITTTRSTPQSSATARAAADTRIATYLRQETILREGTQDDPIAAQLQSIRRVMAGEYKKLAVSLPHTIQPSYNPAPHTQRVVEAQQATLAGKLNYRTQASIPIKVMPEGTIFRSPITNTATNRPISIPQEPTNTLVRTLQREQERENLAGGASPQPAVIVKAEAPESKMDALKRNETMLRDVREVINVMKEYNTRTDQPIIDPSLFSKKEITPTEKNSTPHPLLPEDEPKASQTREHAVPPTPVSAPAKTGTAPVIPTPPPKPPARVSEAQVQTLQEQNEKILKALHDTHSLVHSLAQQKEEPAAPTPTQAHSPAPALSSPISNKERAAPPSEPMKVSAPTPAIATPSLTTLPNVMNGTVIGPQKELIADAIVLISDHAHIPKWASKTNNAGQFIMTNAVANGHYFISVQKPGYRFDTIAVDAQGAPLPAVVISGQLAR